MDVIECIKKRRSIKKFSSIDVEWYKIGQLIEAGKSAPSAGNMQDFRFIVVHDPDKIKAIAHICLDQHWIETASHIIVVCADTRRSEQLFGIRGLRLYSIQNCAAATQNILLAATSMGLGATWVSGFDESELQDLLSCPNFIRPQSVIPVGIPNEKVPTPLQRSLESITYLEQYEKQSGGKIEGVEVFQITKDFGDARQVQLGRLKHRSQIQGKRLSEFFEDVYGIIKKRFNKLKKQLQKKK